MKQKKHTTTNNSKILLDKMNHEYGGTLEKGHMFSYPTDGLIFMPINKPLYNFKVCNKIPGEHKPLLWLESTFIL